MKINRLNYLLAIAFSFYVHTTAAQDLVSMGAENQIVYALEMSPDSQYLAATNGSQIALWDFEKATLRQELEYHSPAKVISLRFTHRQPLLLSGTQDGQVVLWDMNTYDVRWAKKMHQGVVTALAFSLDEQWVASAATDDRIVVSNTQTGKTKWELTGHTDDITALVFKPDGSLLISGGADKQLLSWDMEDGQQVQSLQGHKSWIRALTFSADSSRMLSSGDDGKLVTWYFDEWEGFQPFKKDPVSSSWLLACEYKSPSRDVYATAGQSGKVVVISPFMKYVYRGKSLIHDLCFLPDGDQQSTRLAIATHGEGIKILNAYDMKQIEER